MWLRTVTDSGVFLAGSIDLLRITHLLLFKQGCQDITGTTALEFFFVGQPLGLVTLGPVKKPAEVTALELPCRTVKFVLALFLVPARYKSFVP